MQWQCINAVTLHYVTKDVNPDRRARRRAETEQRLVASATTLFVERGYTATTLADVADHAQIAARTLYLHFPTKADLLLRCVGVAIAGDDEPIPLAERPALAEVADAPSLDERLQRMASFTAVLMERTGPLLDVAFQAAPYEPSIAAAAQAGRDETRRVFGAFCQQLHDDDLLPPSTDVAWLTETATLVAHAETYLLLRRTTGWDIDTYRAWLTTTWRRLAEGAG